MSNQNKTQQHSSILNWFTSVKSNKHTEKTKLIKVQFLVPSENNLYINRVIEHYLIPKKIVNKNFFLHTQKLNNDSIYEGGIETYWGSEG